MPTNQGNMKTSDEIKTCIKELLASEDYIDLYFEVFEELKDTNGIQELKALNYRWIAACEEIRKEENFDIIDGTFFRSIVCYNTVCNFKDKDIPRRTKEMWKRETGWDAEAITSGKHCKLAQAIIGALQIDRKTKQHT